jgi:hypothetical protein
MAVAFAPRLPQARKCWYCSSLLLRVQLFLELFDGLLPLRLLVLYWG